MPKPFLGVGVGFPVGLVPAGEAQTAGASASDRQLQLAAYEESVRQSILIIMGTAKGERVMRPDFGCGIYELVFEPQTASTAGQVSQAVQEALLRFEPRIDVLAVQVVPHTGPTEAILHIHLSYRVRATNNAFNLVYPFYLERSVP